MIRLHLGCGSRNFGPSWYHIDGGDYEHLVGRDIGDLQFEEGGVDLIYASHVLEYFDRTEVIPVLREWYRVLKKDGILRLAVPSFEAISRLYVASSFPLDSFLGPLYGRMEMGGKWIYHKTVYDYASLDILLTGAGFRRVGTYDWREVDHADCDDFSQSYLPHMQKDTGELISLNVEAVK
jgi:predicted SAM-dependent methyltransferase